jgi:sugar lactone lactonase YvrE
VEAPVSFALPRERGGYVLGHRDAVALVDGDGVVEQRWPLEADRPGNRLNDGKCDARGRLWAGTMSLTREPGAAALYRIEPDGAIEQVVAGATISNGLAWTPAGDQLLWVDSTTQRVDVFDFDLDAGRLSGRRTLLEVPAADGLPDGLAMDAEGGVWLTLFGGGQVRRYSPAGQLDVVIDLPTSNPTSPGFGGPELDRLFVTSARHRLTAQQLRAQTVAGALFVASPGVAGLAMHRFGG